MHTFLVHAFMALGRQQQRDYNIMYHNRTLQSYAIGSTGAKPLHDKTKRRYLKQGRKIGV